MDADSEVLRSPIELSESSPGVLEHRSRLDARHSLADAVLFWLHQLNLIAEGIVRIDSVVSVERNQSSEITVSYASWLRESAKPGPTCEEMPLSSQVSWRLAPIRSEQPTNLFSLAQGGAMATRRTQCGSPN
jgi:hypothetical protein